MLEASSTSSEESSDFVLDTVLTKFASEKFSSFTPQTIDRMTGHLLLDKKKEKPFGGS